MPYCLAAVIVDGMVTPAQFKEEKLRDPQIRELLPRIKVVAEPEFEKLFPRLKATEVTITTTDGRQFTLRVDYPRGDYRDPMSEEELLAKFESMVLEKVGKEKRDRMVELILNLEKIDDVRDFMNWMKQ